MHASAGKDNNAKSIISKASAKCKVLNLQYFYCVYEERALPGGSARLLTEKIFNDFNMFFKIVYIATNR